MAGFNEEAPAGGGVLHNSALLVLNLRRQASRARRLAEGTRPDVKARLLTYADEFESRALALEAEASGPPIGSLANASTAEALDDLPLADPAPRAL